MRRTTAEHEGYSGSKRDNLHDFKEIWPYHHPAPVINQQYLDEYPEVAEIMNTVIASLDL